MQINVINSGSKGNCYLLSDESGETLILDAGVKTNEIKKSMSFNFAPVSGVLITHEHGDHSLSADELEIYGLDVWRPYLVESGRDRNVFGKYAVESFPVEHDGTPCCGFYIRHISGFKMLYLTDLEYCKYNFHKQMVETILIEVNWQTKYLETAAENYRHKVLGHLSLDNAIGFLKANKTDALQKVIICHQSMWTMDEEECLDRIRQEIGVEVEAARKDKTFYL